MISQHSIVDFTFIKYAVCGEVSSCSRMISEFPRSLGAHHCEESYCNTVL
jgi:hypothetical protein